MSWGRSANGTVAVVLAAIANWPAEVKNGDELNPGTSEQVKALHQGEASKVVEAVEAALQYVPDGYTVAVSGGGYCSIRNDGTVAVDAWNIGISQSEPEKPTENAEAPE